jgi:hypothetical protein
MSESRTLKVFYSIFKGNESFFVKHQAPFTETEGKLKASWCGFAVYNKHNPPPDGGETGDYIPVTLEHYREHLNGGDGLAIAPLMNTADKRNVCFYGVIDIDVYNVNFAWLVRRLYKSGFKFSAFLSKSGGLHIYFFFVDAEPGDKVIKTLKRVTEAFGLDRLFVNGKNKSKVEIFPKQAVFVPGDSAANCLFLPFYNAANKDGCRTKMLTAEGKTVGIIKALPMIEGMFTSVKEVNAVLDELPYSDAPYCIQVILLAGALEEGDGRNNFLFAAAIYLKKKYKGDFYEALSGMNDCLEAPLEKKDVDSVYKSVTEKGYDRFSCTKPPCSEYCDKTLCAKREFCQGKERGNHFTGAYCWGALSKVMAKDPYYQWEVRIKPDGEFKTVRIDSVDDLQNQATVQKRCWRDLNWAPFTVKMNDWIAIVNEAMEGIEERRIEVPQETDTTMMSALRVSFVRYLTHKQIQNGQPYMVRLGQVYHADGAYYFITKGLVDFLQTERFTLGRVNLREQLISYGCSEGEVKYKTSKGEERVVKCWKKADDPELLEMDVFYEDIYDGDADILQKNKSDKPEKREVTDGDDTRF